MFGGLSSISMWLVILYIQNKQTKPKIKSLSKSWREDDFGSNILHMNIN